MCPELKGTICNLTDLSPENVECASVDRCLGKEWFECSVYNAQFFFDINDRFVLDML
jgi:hypothetical protein